MPSPNAPSRAEDSPVQAPLDTAASVRADDGEAATPISRRRFLRRSLKGAAVAAAGTLLYTWRIEPHWVEFVQRPMILPGLPDALVGKRLVQVSDLHVGPVVDSTFLVRSLEQIADHSPDVIVMTGDFMSCNHDEEVGRALEVIRALPPAPLGRFAINGNHDFGDHWRQDEVADKLADGLERLDVRPLRNEVADLGGLQLAGVDDLWSRTFQPERVLEAVDPRRPLVTLVHNPDAVDLPVWGSFHGWALSGHTHGGQCKPPFLPPPCLPVSNRQYVAGEYALSGGRQLYINRGLGYLERVRFNCRPEITVFTLERPVA